MKEAEKRARITVAYGGLVLLKKNIAENPDHKTTRNHLFALPKDEEKNAENVKALRTKDWQRSYIQRLLDAEILTKVMENSQELYKVLDPKAIAKIIIDHDSYGLRLSRFLFPKEAGIPAELSEEGEDEEVDEDGEIKVIDSEEQPSIVELENAEGEKEFRISAKAVKSLLTTLNGIIEQREMTIKLMQVVVKQYEVVEAAVNTQRAEAQTDREFPSYVRNRFKELEAKLDKLHESQGLAARALALIEVEVRGLPGLIKALVPNLAAVLGLPEGKTLAIFVDGIMKHYLVKLTNREMGALKEVLFGLRAKIADLGAVEDLAMRAIEAVEKGEVPNDGGA